MAGLKVGLLPLVSPQVSVKEWTWWTTRAAPGTNTASTVRDAPSVCPTSVSLPRATTSSAPPVVTSSDGAPAHCPTAVYTISSLFLFVWFLHKGKKGVQHFVWYLGDYPRSDGNITTKMLFVFMVDCLLSEGMKSGRRTQIKTMYVFHKVVFQTADSPLKQMSSGRKQRETFF